MTDPRDGLWRWCTALADLVAQGGARDASVTLQDRTQVVYTAGRGAVVVGASGRRLDIPEDAIARMTTTAGGERRD